VFDACTVETIRHARRTMRATGRLLGVAALLAIETTRPQWFVDRGVACPDECCQFRTWTVERTTAVYERASKTPRQIAHLKKGDTVEALRGEVHTPGTRFVVTRPYVSYQAQYARDDVLWVYTYLGEGYFKVWYKGRMYREELLFSPHGGTAGRRCEVSPDCWGTLEQAWQYVWWVVLQLNSGDSGCVKDVRNLRGWGGCHRPFVAAGTRRPFASGHGSSVECEHVVEQGVGADKPQLYSRTAAEACSSTPGLDGSSPPPAALEKLSEPPASPTRAIRVSADFSSPPSHPGAEAPLDGPHVDPSKFF